jgi:hypothetical protein
MKFIICCPIQDAHYSNGITSLIALDKTLRKQGYTSKICITQSYPDESKLISLPLLKRSSDQDPEGFARSLFERINSRISEHGLDVFDPNGEESVKDYIVIYSEVITDNPLNAPRIARYLGNKEGILKSGKKATASRNEFIFAHSKVLSDRADHILYFARQNPLFNNVDSIPTRFRKLDVTYIGKGKLYVDQAFLLPNTVEITRFWPPDKQQLSILLRNCRFFYTYDAWSNINVEAVLCGAVPAFVNNGPWTDDEIDGAEIGRLPRIKRGTTEISEKFFNDFDTERADLIDRIERVSAAYESSVEELASKMKKFFYGRSLLSKIAYAVAQH